MIKDNREKERSLQKEAIETSQQEEATHFICLLRRRPGERHITKVKLAELEK